jgi:hypothetical protein
LIYALNIKSNSPLIVFLAKSSLILFMMKYIEFLISYVTGGLNLRIYYKNLINTVGLKNIRK